ncbi:MULTISPECIES: adenosylmethionine decarboxylase [Rhizobium/Agrobacterium group]|uniref:Adenosylmethionine decarboxylase n=1 Tax=Agrobacterium vitis TaxID=373 RepID=A0ABW9TIE7_AGRVI|nr:MULTISPECIES: adenosylmethionine decarboxylase [Rhizobium/Agrobacterium group]MCF1450576.1 adenosylmethionine decarboxylase [Allorhizobium ampelinum]MCF1463513.1 adenosylmethionine decarboxylase [Allorhizobium ampelinum]MCF1470755.1 adenosylmethionine decarboxylase [Allorhizobium ampelinum]MCF1496177.1 adenosylmethionine decarboxylase [Allorhizobium ampelinum]MUO30664.1 adenosylmethionine decarboxylase [Agrobacterium vitis]
MDHLNIPGEYGSYVEIDGQSCLGSHYIGEIFGAVGMDDPHFVEATLRKCALSAGATILQSNMHHFPSGGVTGIVILSESHISIHSWPEHDYAAIDIFMCGRANISEAVRVLETDFMPKRLIGTTLLRGHDDHGAQAAVSLSQQLPAMALNRI